MNFEQYITETLNEAKKPVEMINESEALVVLGTLAAALVASGSIAAIAVNSIDGSLKKSFNGIVKDFRYKSLNKKAKILINSDDEVQQAFKAYTEAPKGQKLKSLKSFMELLGSKLDTEHSGLLQKVIGDLKAEYRKQDKKLNESVDKPKFDKDVYIKFKDGKDKYEVRISKVSKKKYTLSDILKNGEEEKGTLSKPVEWIDTNAKVLK